MNYSRLNGLIAAPFTPFREDGSLNIEMIERQAEGLVKNGVTGAFICGTTGEGASLTVPERETIAERWRAVATSKLRLIVHIGDNSIDNCRRLAAHAQKIKADGFACFAPSFFKPSNVADLVEFSAEVAAAAPELPFYFYHIPSMTGVNACIADYLEAAADRIPNLMGVKFTHENLMDLMACHHLQDGKFDMIYGRDEALLAGLATGSRAAIGTTYNFAAPIYLRLIAAFERGDWAAARKEQHRSVQIIKLLASHGFLPAAKATMGFLNLEMGPTRLPLRALNPQQKSKLEADLRKLGFFDWLNA